MPSPTTEQAYRLGRNYVRTGDPVRWRNHRGLFRFDGIESDADETTHAQAVLKLFGPASARVPRVRFVHAGEVIRVRPTEALRIMVAGRDRRE